MKRHKPIGLQAQLPVDADCDCCGERFDTSVSLNQQICDACTEAMTAPEFYDWVYHNRFPERLRA